jgi:hypothetical protein
MNREREGGTERKREKDDKKKKKSRERERREKEKKVVGRRAALGNGQSEMPSSAMAAK